MRKTFKYRIYPTKAQDHILQDTLEECRWLYNKTLGYRKELWETKQESISLYGTHKLLTTWKTEKVVLRNIHSQVLQDVCVRVDLALRAFFQRVKHGNNPGYPRFKGKGRYDSFTYGYYGWGSFRIEGKLLRLSKIGLIKIKLHRPIEGTIKTLTIKRESTGKWFACFSCDVPECHLPVTDSVVGIDLGLETFATLSDGSKIENPRFFRKGQSELKRVQRKLSSEKKGSLERNKRCKIVAKVHTRIDNKRSNFAHQLSRKLINQHGTIVFEGLNIQKMLQSKIRGLNKSIEDAAWNQLVNYTTYKAEEAGRKVIIVDPKNTSKMCSRCGALVSKKLSDRVHKCPYCSLELDRDVNAAINILRLGLQSQQQSRHRKVLE